MLSSKESAMHTGWASGLEAEHNSGAPELQQFCDYCEEMTEHSTGLDTECEQCGCDYGGNAHDLIQKLEQKIDRLGQKIAGLEQENKTLREERKCGEVKIG